MKRPYSYLLEVGTTLAHACLALTLAFAGRGCRAIAVIDRAMQLSPHDPFSSMFAAARAFSSYMAEDYSGGLEWARRAVRMNPDLAGYWRPRALCAAALGLDEEAKGAVAAVIRLQSDFSVAWVEESPIAHPEDRARYCETLRPFGLPEK